MNKFFLCAVMLALMLCVAGAGAEEQAALANPVRQEWVRIGSPAENAEVVGKKPDIKGEFLAPIDIGSLVIMVDGVDVTQVSEVSAKGFSYSPSIVLSSGAHTVSLAGTDQSGQPVQKNIAFSSRHTTALAEAYSNNTATILYENALRKAEGDASPNSKVEGNLSSETRIKGNDAEVGFKTNLRYYDQNTPLQAVGSLKKGVSLVNYILSSNTAKSSSQRWPR